MAIATETLFPGESLGSSEFKLVRLARQFRAMDLVKESHITVVGCLAGSHLLRDRKAFEAEIEGMIDHLIDVKFRLIDFGVREQAIRGHLPYQVAPIIQNVITVTAQDIAPKPLYPGTGFVSPKAVPGPGEPEEGPQAQVVIDPFAKGERDKHRAGRTVELTVELEVWDAKGYKLPPSPSITIAVGPNGLEEVSAEITVLKGEIEKKRLWGASRISITVKAAAKVEFDHSTPDKLIGKFGTEVSVALEAEFKRRGIRVKVGIQPSIGVDSAGEAVPGVKLVVQF